MQIEPDRFRKLTAQIASLQLSSQSIASSADRSESLDVIESAPSLNDPDPFDLCLEGERRAHLAQAIAQLSEREQLILSLYYREELTMKEIAQIVGIAISRVSQIRQAIMLKLRVSLNHLESHPIPSASNRGEYYEHA
jgi:RNA polymerase sigma factor for flagellar operon FliA